MWTFAVVVILDNLPWINLIISIRTNILQFEYVNTCDVRLFKHMLNFIKQPISYQQINIAKKEWTEKKLVKISVIGNKNIQQRKNCFVYKIPKVGEKLFVLFVVPIKKTGNFRGNKN